MKNIFAFIFGGLFSLGLMISGMSNPAKVLGFLDIFGQWDISLMFVMLGAIAVAFIPFQRAIKKPKPFLMNKFNYQQIHRLTKG
ncbi:transporter component [Acinetobacter baumannii ABNIH10]|nr:transporter component [Acinetobacter baumannii ABNIH10]